MRHLLILGVFSLVLAGNVFAETKTIQNIYENAGTYTPCVTVCDSLGACSPKVCLSSPIIVRDNKPPVVTLSCAPTSGLAPLSVTCTATATDPDGDSMTYTWDFGDALPPPESLIQTHVYPKGTYEPSITVKDSEGNETTESVEINAKGRLGCK